MVACPALALLPMGRRRDPGEHLGQRPGLPPQYGVEDHGAHHHHRIVVDGGEGAAEA